jgi:hypothetical protein
VRESAPFDFGPLVTERLEILTGVLEPMCASRCRPLVAVADPDLDVLTALRSSDWAVLYRPESIEQMLEHSESFLMWALGHEVGHSIDIALGAYVEDDPWAAEMRADAIAGCALAELRVPLEPMRAAMTGYIPAEGSRASRLDLACGTDREHPALKWELEAFDAGARLCRTGVVSLGRVYITVQGLLEIAQRKAADASISFGTVGAPCSEERW